MYICSKSLILRKKQRDLSIRIQIVTVIVLRINIYSVGDS